MSDRVQDSYSPREQLLVSPRQARRQAVAPLRGFVYQMHQTVSAWMSLHKDDDLYVETLGDFARASRSSNVVTLTEVKDQNRTVTLNSLSVKTAISTLFDIQRDNPCRKVHLQFITSAEAGREREILAETPDSGLELWKRVADGDTADASDIEYIRQALRKNYREGALAKFVRESLDDVLRDELIKRVDFRFASSQGVDLAKSNRRRAAEVSRNLGLDPGLGYLLYQHLLCEVIEVTLNTKERKLDKEGLTQCITAACEIPTPVTIDERAAERFRRNQIAIIGRFLNGLRDSSPAISDTSAIKARHLAVYTAFDREDLSAADAFSKISQDDAELSAAVNRKQIDFQDEVAHLANSRAFAGYLGAMVGADDEAEAWFHRGYDAISDTLPVPSRVLYLLGVTDVLRELGKADTAQRWSATSEKELMKFSEFRVVRTQVSAGERLETSEISRWLQAFQLLAKLLVFRARLHADLGGHDDLMTAGKLGEEAERFARVAADAPLTAECKLLNADVARRSHQTRRSRALLLSIVCDAARTPEIRRTAAFAHGALGQISLASERLHRSKYYFDRAVAMIDEFKAQDPVAAGILLGDRAKALYRRGDLIAATLDAERARIALRARHPRCEVYTLRTAGDIAVELGEADTARAFYDEAVKIAVNIKNAHCLAMASSGRGRWWLLHQPASESANGAFVDFNVAIEHCERSDPGLFAEAAAGLGLAGARIGSEGASEFTSQALTLAEAEGVSFYARGWVWASAAAVPHPAERIGEHEIMAARSEEAMRRGAPVLQGLAERLMQDRA